MPLRDQHRFASPRARTVKQFRLLDADANARLGRDDLEATKDKSLAELQMATQERMTKPGFTRQMTVLRLQSPGGLGETQA